MKLDIGLPSDYPNFEAFGPTPCSEQDPEIFFAVDSPEGNLQNKPVYVDEQATKSVCRSCPYQINCLGYALSNTDLQGIWGGTTEKERAAIRRGRGVKLQRSLGLSPTRNL